MSPLTVFLIRLLADSLLSHVERANRMLLRKDVQEIIRNAAWKACSLFGIVGDLDDVFQETCLQLHQKWSKGGLQSFAPSKGSAEAWVYWVARNAAHDIAEKMVRHREKETQSLESTAPPVANSDPIEDAIRAEFVQRAKDVTRELIEKTKGEKRKQILEAAAEVLFEGLSPDVAAKKAGCHVAQIYRAVMFLLQHLRKTLGPDFGPESE